MNEDHLQDLGTNQHTAPGPGDGSIDPEELAPLLFALRTPRRHLTSAPDFVPQTFLEQIQLYDDGVDRRLYLYVNGTWRYVALT